MQRFRHPTCWSTCSQTTDLNLVISKFQRPIELGLALSETRETIPAARSPSALVVRNAIRSFAIIAEREVTILVHLFLTILIPYTFLQVPSCRPHEVILNSER